MQLSINHTHTILVPIHPTFSKQDLPDQFCEFFSDKIEQIRTELDLQSCEPPSFSVYDWHVLSQFQPVSEEDILDILSKSSIKSCCLDPKPTTFMKQYFGDLIPLITAIVNHSLATGSVAASLVEASRHHSSVKEAES